MGFVRKGRINTSEEKTWAGRLGEATVIEYGTFLSSADKTLFPCQVTTSPLKELTGLTLGRLTARFLSSGYGYIVIHILYGGGVEDAGRKMATGVKEAAALGGRLRNKMPLRWGEAGDIPSGVGSREAGGMYNELSLHLQSGGDASSKSQP